MSNQFSKQLAPRQSNTMHLIMHAPNWHLALRIEQLYMHWAELMRTHNETAFKCALWENTKKNTYTLFDSWNECNLIKSSRGASSVSVRLRRAARRCSLIRGGITGWWWFVLTRECAQRGVAVSIYIILVYKPFIVCVLWTGCWDDERRRVRIMLHV